MKLVDADRLFESIYDNVSAPYEEAVAAKEECLREIEDASTVDAVPVVRCEDCASGMKSDDNKYIICCGLGIGMEFDDFCSHSERKETE